MAALAGLHGSAVPVTVGAVLAAVAATAVLSVRGRRSPAALRVARHVAAAVLLGACLGAAVTAARLAERDSGALRGPVHARATVDVELVISDDPHAARAVAGRQPTYVVAARLRSFRAAAGPPVRAAARVLVLGSDPGWRGLLPGQVVRATGRLSPSRGGDLRAGVLSVSAAPEPVGGPPWYQRAAGRLRTGLQKACAPLPAEPGGLLPGLVIGDTSRLDPGLEDDFVATGLTHLTAVSGSNCAIVVGAVLLLARAARAGPRTAAVVSVLALVGFVILARPSPSVLRAAAMGGIALVGLATGRPRAALPALGATVVVLVAVDPELAGHPGFALSVLATSGLLVLAPRWRDGLRRRRVPAGVAEALAVPAAAQAACAPVIAGMSGVVSLISMPANLVAVPAVAPATVCGVLAAILSPAWPSGAEFLAWVGSWPARWLVAIARYGAQAPAGEIPWPDGTGGGLLLGGVLAVALVAGRWRSARRVVLVVVLVVAVVAVPVRLVVGGWPPPDWIVVACDVGQGDATVLAAGPHTAVVVDAGPEPDAVDRCLSRLGVTRILMLAVTHFHVDHTGGVEGVLRGRSVGGVVTTAFPEPAGGRAAVHAAARSKRVPVIAASPDWSARWGSLAVRSLGLAEPLRGTRSDPNNNSLILAATVGRHSVLLLGDAEVEQQSALLTAYGPAVRAEVVKLAHHGSAFQDKGMLDAVGAGAVLVSVGAGNDYGHPNGPVLARLAHRGARIMRTDRVGDIAIVTRAGALAMVGERR
ncbi:ComEC/Rec2 family competence protein [Virgisporangium aliadipatigenens]|nr:ComEC/Rec2 family competence protein [Virgisporangium aliadipatigenens]